MPFHPYEIDLETPNRLGNLGNHLVTVDIKYVV